jgi:hypothetical protein
MKSALGVQYYHGELCKYLIQRVKFQFSTYFPRMPLLCTGKNDKKLGPEECLVQDFLFVIHSRSLSGLGFLYIITSISCTIYLSTGKQLQFLFINGLFEMQSLHWLILWVTGLKWFKKHKGKNIFIPEAHQCV